LASRNGKKLSEKLNEGKRRRRAYIHCFGVCRMIPVGLGLKATSNKHVREERVNAFTHALARMSVVRNCKLVIFLPERHNSKLTP